MMRKGDTTMNRDKLLHDILMDLVELRGERPSPKDDTWEQGYFAGAINYLQHYAIEIEGGAYS